MNQFRNQRKEKLTIDLLKSKRRSLIWFIPIILIFGLPYYLIWKVKFSVGYITRQLTFMDFGVVGSSVLILLVGVLGIIAHELIHGITCAMFTKSGFKSIKFSVLWQMAIPYCHCRESLLIKQYIFGTIMPAIVLGFIPVTLALVTGHLGLFIFGSFFTMASGKDFMIIYSLRNKKRNDLVRITYRKRIDYYAEKTR